MTKLWLVTRVISAPYRLSLPCPQMAIIFSEEDLKNVSPPCVIQSFINHNAVLYKVFVVGDSYTVVERPSLKNFPAGPSGKKTERSSLLHRCDLQSLSKLLNKRPHKFSLWPLWLHLFAAGLREKPEFNKRLPARYVLLEMNTVFHYKWPKYRASPPEKDDTRICIWCSSCPHANILTISAVACFG